jgi:hypothetical protein
MCVLESGQEVCVLESGREVCVLESGQVAYVLESGREVRVQTNTNISTEHKKGPLDTAWEHRKKYGTTT